jgi:alpha-tubulin suppressor-like RCC1 family protein
LCHYQCFVVGKPVLDDGSVWAWGNNDRGQLGIGNTDSQLSPVKVAFPWARSRQEAAPPIPVVVLVRAAYEVVGEAEGRAVLTISSATWRNRAAS